MSFRPTVLCGVFVGVTNARPRVNLPVSRAIGRGDGHGDVGGDAGVAEEDFAIIQDSSSSPPATNTTPTSPADKGLSTAGIVSLSTFLPLAFLILVLALFFLYRRKRTSIKLAYKVSVRSRRRNSLHPISILEFNSQYLLRTREGDIEKEFELLQKSSSQIYEQKPRDIGEREDNKAKNRFANVVPYDETLVTLKHKSGIPPSDYINASYLTANDGEDLFIATQGPKRNTVVDFWNMILEQKVDTVVCLTNVVEGGQVKCFQYWPNVQEMLHFDELTLFTKTEMCTNEGSCVVRTIQVTREDPDDDSGETEESRTITQFHLTSWADHGVPSSPTPLLNLCRSLLGRLSSSTPMVVHCSAGVGRTGTLLATLAIMKQIEYRRATEVEIPSVVARLREQRPKMVQNLDQYVFIYDSIKEYLNVQAPRNLPRTRGYANKALELSEE